MYANPCLHWMCMNVRVHGYMSAHLCFPSLVESVQNVIVVSSQGDGARRQLGHRTSGIPGANLFVIPAGSLFAFAFAFGRDVCTIIIGGCL